MESSPRITTQEGNCKVRVKVSKRLSANDLGLTGTHQAGILIPKRQEVIGFFPMLDEESYNPSCKVAIFLPDLGEFVELRFIHYNGKRTGASTRDEYRLTGTTRVLRVLGASEGDILEFTRSANGDVHVRVLDASANDEGNIFGDVIPLSGGWQLIRI